MKKLLYIPLIMLFSFLPQKKTRVIFFGDSITELGAKPGGFIPRIDSICKANKLGDEYEFIGAGVGANKVYDLYLRLEDDVLAKNPDIVIIYIGVNDVWHKALLGTGTDPDKFDKFYQAILNKLKAKNIRAILCTPAVIGEKNDFSNPQDGDLNRYSNIVRKIASRNDLVLVDLRTEFLQYLHDHNPQNTERGILTYDGVHMNGDGNEFLAEKMWNGLRSTVLTK